MTGFTLHFKGETGDKNATFYVSSVTKRLENNQAIEEAKKWADERGITIYKTSMKQQGSDIVMEVHFIFPEIAERHAADLEELSYRIGMPVTYAKNPKQNEMIAITLSCLPAEWIVKKNPSIHIEKKTIAITLAEAPSEKVTEEVVNKVHDFTGYTLIVN